MTLHLPPYPTYKPSGVDWLGDVPAHWEVRRLKTLCSMRSGDGISVTLIESSGKYPVYGGNGLRGYTSDYNHDGAFVLIGRQGALCGNVHIAQGRFWATEHAVVATHDTGHNVVWFGAILTAMNLNQYSIAAAQPGLAVERILNLHMPVPLLAEQRAIARYLDHVDRRIQRYIEAKEQLIALLQEARQSIIQRAVTRGLDPDVPLKPSGVEWLGKVPAHWEVRRLKTLCSMKSGDGISVMSIESTGEYPVYGGNGLRGYTSDYTHDGAFVLIGRQGALCGNVHIAQGKFWATEHAVVATHDTGHSVLWFGAILTAMNLNQYSIAAAQPGLAIERILNLHLPVPPMQEQDQIAAHLDQATAAIDRVIDNARRQSERMAEYRASLIAHAVTGKLDVRAAVSLLQEVSE